MKKAFLKLRSAILKGANQGDQYEFTINTNGTESVFVRDLEYKEMNLIHYPLFNDTINDLPFTFTLTVSIKNLGNNMVSPVQNVTLVLDTDPFYAKTIVAFDPNNVENFPIVELYWESNPFSSVFSELEKWAKCLCKTVNYYESMPPPQQGEYDNFNLIELQAIFTELSKISTSLGCYFVPYDPSLTLCQNLRNLVDNLRICKEAWDENLIVVLDYNTLESNFQTFNTSVEGFYSTLKMAGIDPCDKVEQGYTFGVLCGLYDKDLDCICKFIAQKSSYTDPNIIAKISQLEAEGEYFLGDIYSFLNQHNITEFPQFDLSGSNPFCAYYTAIIGYLKWLCENQHNYPFEPEKVFDLQDGWTKILALLDELKAMDPGLCSGSDLYGAVVQSRYIYLQAIGSDDANESAGIAEGIHLRWALRNEIGDNHLPKGDLANFGNPYHANFGYIKDNDFVEIRKTPYINTVPIEFDLATTNPYDVVSSTDERSWHFVVNNTHGSHTIQNEIEFRFFDFTSYDAITIDPKVDAQGFLASYTEYFEIEVKNKLMFAADLELKSVSGSSPNLKYETIKQDDPAIEEFEITARQDISNASTDINQRIVGESIRYFRVQGSAGNFGMVSLETYEDFIHTRTWTHLDNFGLTTDNTEAYSRLDNALWPKSIDNNWPRYNNGTTLKKSNYEDKWVATDDGLKQAVEDYLDLSKSDLKAIKNLESQDPKDTATPKPVLPVSYLDLLNMVSMDYHAARMLGLGHIDEFNPGTDKYVYLAIYSTHPHMPVNRTIKLEKHMFMSLPTDKQDYRNSQAPVADNVSYGLGSMDEAIEKSILKDGGYARFGDVRFVGINRAKYNYEIPFEGFFETPGTFDITEKTKPVFYGIEYGDKGAGTYVKPEITADSSGYKDHDNNLTEVFETVPVAEGENPLYTHRETNEGEHEYALYGINWFSRASAISNVVDTDETSFDFNPIKPPLDANAHFIQEENPLIFTSASEQTDLQARITADPNADNFWTRVTFNWNHLHNIAYKDANKIEFFYREEPPMVVRGMVKSVTPVHNEDAVLVATKSYKETSTEANTEISPAIAPADEPKFIGSLLMIENESYEVISITQDTDGPVFKVRITSEIQSVPDSEDPALLSPILTWNTPKANSYFQITENLNDESNWSKISKSIDIVSFSPFRTESIVEPGGELKTYNIGGLEGDAIVIADPDPQPIEGLYKISFDTQTLSDHPQKTSEHVDWYQGVIRVPTNGGEMKGLKVVRIESQNPLVVWAMDVEPVSGSSNTAVKTDASNSVDVNFHPGYRVYLEPESAINLDKATLVPSGNETKKVALIALRAIDDANPDPAKHAKSKFTSPLTIFGLNIKEPQKPETPIGPAYSTRPDTFGKASYTFDVETTQEPFSLAVYRAHDLALLEAIYEEATVEAIYADLEALEPNDHQIERFNDLANVILDTDPAHEGEWKEYDGYRLPEPDLAGLLDGNETLAEKEHKIRVAIVKEFIPVSEQPVVYEFTKDGENTSNAKPNIRDKNGNLLDATDAEFNPFPYARKFVSSVDSKAYFRFTDYKLDGASQNLYFYFAVEITRELKMGEPSQILGPVRIINSFPAEAPFIKKVETVLANPALEIGPGVRFSMNPYLPEEGIRAFRIYRTTNEAMTASVQLMEDAGTYVIGDDVVDYFDGLTFPPFEEDIFYRIVALREILNEQDAMEYIPSKPSQVVKGQVVDNVNPEAPEISHTIGSTSSSPDKIHNVVLTWAETCYKGKYTLYKMTDMGQWQLVDSYDYTDTLEYTYVDLDKEDADGDAIYHRFKVVAENTGGLLSLEEEILTI